MRNTKSTLIFLILAAFTVSILYSMNAASGKAKKIGQVSFLIGAKGDILVQHAASEEWISASLNTSIFDQDKIKTLEESRCEVTLVDKSVIRIGENSEFAFSEASIKDYKKNIKSELTKGRVWLNIQTLNDGNEQFQIKTPTAVCAVRGTIYRIDSDSATTCLVYDGAVDVGPTQYWGSSIQTPTNSLQPVEVQGPYEVPPPYQVSLDDWVRIVKGFQIIVRPDGKFAKSQINDAQDADLDWVKWNKERDTQIKK